MTSIHFGILSIGSTADSLEQCWPLLENLQKRIAQPVMTDSVDSYVSLSNAMGA